MAHLVELTYPLLITPGVIAGDGQKENCGWEDFGIVQI